jgi:N-acetylglucosamine kinase-like BadF-type ATPase
VLERRVPEHFGVATPHQLAWEIHTGRIAQRRAVELAPVVFAASTEDAVADAILVRQAEEVVALVRASAARLELTGMDVVLGGGLMRGASERLLDLIRDGLDDLDLTLLRTSTPPIVGAALLALDKLGADETARLRARAQLEEVF